MVKIVLKRIEGSSIENYTVLNYPAQVFKDEFESWTDAVDHLEYEANRMRRNGAEVVFSGPYRAFVINESNEPTEVLDVVEY